MQALEESDWSFQQGTGCTQVGTQVSPAVVKAMLGDGREMQSIWGNGVVFSAEGPEKELTSVNGRKGSS